MKIGFDLDGIFVEGPPLIPKRVIEWLYRGPHDHEPKYRFPTTKLEQMIRKWSHQPLLRPKHPENIKFLKDISKKTWIYLISSRFSFLKIRTKVILNKYGIDEHFDGVYFNFENKQPHLFKNEIIRKLKIDLYVDDDLSLLHFLARRNPKTFFFWFNNKENGQFDKNLFAINHLSQIFKIK